MDAGRDDVFKDERLLFLQSFARCGDCVLSSAPAFDERGYPLTEEEAASQQWIKCAQCRSGTHDWYRR